MSDPGDDRGRPADKVCQDCDEEATWMWWNGMGGIGRYCDDHAREELPSEEDLPSYKRPITTEENVTKLRGETAIIPGGGVMPLDSTYPVVRARESFDEVMADV